MFGRQQQMAAMAPPTMDALHPLVYLPFHLAGHHMIARTFGNKKIMYPAHLVFAVTQYLVEHYSAEFPSIASLNGALVAIAIFVTTPLFYYNAYKKTTGPKSLVLGGVGVFFAVLPVFKGLELGFPKDDPLEQAAANLDPVHSYWHLALHLVLFFNGLMTTFYVPWDPEKTAARSTVPSSPKHRTLNTASAHKTSQEACSPKIKVKHTAAAWPKPKAA